MILKTSVKTGRQCFLSEFKATCGKNARKWCKWQQGQAPLEMATACLRCFLNFQGQTSWHQVTQSYLRCIRGTTQNPNECINSMVWVRCLKHKHHGTKFVVYPAALAVCHFHKGAEYRKDIMNELSIHSETPRHPSYGHGKEVPQGSPTCLHMTRRSPSVLLLLRIKNCAFFRRTAPLRHVEICLVLFLLACRLPSIFCIVPYVTGYWRFVLFSFSVFLRCFG